MRCPPHYSASESRSPAASIRPSSLQLQLRLLVPASALITHPSVLAHPGLHRIAYPSRALLDSLDSSCACQPLTWRPSLALHYHTNSIHWTIDQRLGVPAERPALELQRRSSYGIEPHDCSVSFRIVVFEV